jgi:hypothetical protein
VTPQNCIDAIMRKVDKYESDMQCERSEYKETLSVARAALHASYPERVKMIWSLLGEDDRPEQPKETRHSVSYSLSGDECAVVRQYEDAVKKARANIASMISRHELKAEYIHGMYGAISAIRSEMKKT